MPTVSREQILSRLRRQNSKSIPLLGVACGSGLMAKHAASGGADFILALNSGRFRQMGIGSLAGFMPYANCNRMVMEFGHRELVPVAGKTPVLFGLGASDPTINLPVFLDQIAANGFAGINNYPSVGLIDGTFRAALERSGLGYANEIEAVRLAHVKGLLTCAFVFDAAQARGMLDAGADIICAHLGLTKGGNAGAKLALSLESGAKLSREVFAVCDALRPGVIKMVYGGPLKTPLDVQFIYENTSAMGHIGGSSLDRIPSENTMTTVINEFRNAGRLSRDEPLAEKVSRLAKRYDYVGIAKEYVAENYMNDISFADVAAAACLSRTHLSALFKKEVGCTFPEYLARLRINKAMGIIGRDNIPLADVAALTGYSDYAHFSKAFKRRTGLSPRDFSKQYKKT